MALRLRASSFYSFRRQLSLYGFKRGGDSCKKPVFSHPFFIKGHSELLVEFTRKKQYNAKSKVALDLPLIQSCLSQLKKVSTVNGSREKREDGQELLQFINSFDRYIGIGLPFFLKELVSRLNHTFPEIASCFKDEFDKTSTALGETQFMRVEDMVNKKEILVRLVNRIIAEVHKNITKREINFPFWTFDNDHYGFNSIFDKISPSKEHRRKIISLDTHNPFAPIGPAEDNSDCNSSVASFVTVSFKEETLSQLDFGAE